MLLLQQILPALHTENPDKNFRPGGKHFSLIRSVPDSSQRVRFERQHGVERIFFIGRHKASSSNHALLPNLQGRKGAW